MSNRINCINIARLFNNVPMGVMYRCTHFQPFKIYIFGNFVALVLPSFCAFLFLSLTNGISVFVKYWNFLVLVVRHCSICSTSAVVKKIPSF